MPRCGNSVSPTQYLSSWSTAMKSSQGGGWGSWCKNDVVSDDVTITMSHKGGNMFCLFVLGLNFSFNMISVK